MNPASVVGGVPLTDRAQDRVFSYSVYGAGGVPVECVGKVYESEEDALRVARVLRGLTARGTVATPRLLGYHAEHRLLLMTYAEGAPLTRALAADDGPVARALGRALAALHAADIVTDRVMRAGAVLHDLRRRVAELQARFPGVADMLGHALADLERDVPTEAVAPVFVHGDFGPANLLWNGRDVVVLDFDRCAMGDPALDLATLFTQLRRSGLRSPGRFPDFAALRARVLETYGVSAPAPARVAWYERAVLLRKIHSLALDTTRHSRPDRIRQRQAEAVRLLEQCHVASV